MKIYLYLLLFCALLSACARKTYVAEHSTLSHNLKNKSDSTIRKSSLLTDKTVTIISKLIDTNIVVSGKALSGYLLPSKSLEDISAHFENEDLNLFLYIDKSGKARATAIPKSKKITAKALEQTTVYNDVVKKEETDIHAKNELAIKTSLAANRTEKQTTGNITFGFSLIIILLVAAAFVLFIRKFNFFGKIF